METADGEFLSDGRRHARALCTHPRKSRRAAAAARQFNARTNAPPAKAQPSTHNTRELMFYATQSKKGRASQDAQNKHSPAQAPPATATEAAGGADDFSLRSS
mmetsp:Transcript_13203/g.20039  ORF Transcript_13203/g.20039 Transcript_13203/m.20039 type:complete len:103 (-) Transcript_13203:897-1205(-)